jgi:hypothetical protein
MISVNGIKVLLNDDNRLDIRSTFGFVYLSCFIDNIILNDLKQLFDSLLLFIVVLFFFFLVKMFCCRELMVSLFQSMQMVSVILSYQMVPITH